MSKDAFLLLDEYDRKLAEYWEDEVLSEQESAKLARIRTKLDRVRKELNSPKGTDPDGAPLVDVASQIESFMVDHFLRWDGKDQVLLTAPQRRNKLWIGDFVGAEVDILADYLSEWYERIENTLRWNVYVESLEPQWRAEGNTVRKGVTQGDIDKKTLKDARQTLHDRVGPGNFDDDVNAYLEKEEEAKLKLNKIGPFEDKFKGHTDKLMAVTLALNFEKAKQEYKVKEKELDQLQADIESAKNTFKATMDIAILVAKQDWVGAATKAFSHLSDEFIELMHESRLDKVRQELERAESKMKYIRTSELRKSIDAQRSFLAAAAGDLYNAQDELKTTLRRLARKRAIAIKQLNKSPATKIAGKMLTDRKTQIASIARARSSCQRFLSGCKDVTKEDGETAKFFRRADNVAKALTRIDPNGSLAWTLGKFATGDLMSLGYWGSWVEKHAAECAKELEWIEQEGMAPFDQAVELIHQGMSGEF